MKDKDMFADWKEKRFIVTPDHLYDPNILGPNLVVLTDTDFWAQHYDELIAGCGFNGGKVNGMCVNFDTRQELAVFVLRWS